MAEEEKSKSDATSEGRRIARNYLSKLGWAREWRRTITREIRPAWTREVMEDKFRRADALEEEAEANLSSEFERLRKSAEPSARETLKTILVELGHRTDLGFFGKRILARLREMLRPF
jgi:hypothetical protein